ncbi:DUF4231 domain-containing protein [Streptomyces spectabilis]|uniref:DUF4231 domain-containing protein n=1 Tax=Streptomyces spectabilis TaxID=68270 RepID=UPI0033C4D850
MTQLGGDSMVMEIWDQQSIWSQAADRLKAEISRARASALMLGIAAAVLGTAASQAMDESRTAGKTLAFAAAVAASLVPLSMGRAGPTQVRNWTRLRSMSEAVKNEVYVCLAGVAPYRGDDPSATLRERVDPLRRDASDLLPCIEGITSVPRVPPAVADVDSYVDLRLKQQIDDYYRPKSAEMGRRLALVRRTEISLGCAGAVLGALSGVFEVGEAAAWVAVAATVGTAVGAHSIASRYAYQQIEFTRTADELERLLLSWQTQDRRTVQSDDTFIRHCEEVISVLNDSWMVRWNAG